MGLGPLKRHSKHAQMEVIFLRAVRPFGICCVYFTSERTSISISTRYSWASHTSGVRFAICSGVWQRSQMQALQTNSSLTNIQSVQHLIRRLLRQDDESGQGACKWHNGGCGTCLARQAVQAVLHRKEVGVHASFTWRMDGQCKSARA